MELEEIKDTIKYLEDLLETVRLVLEVEPPAQSVNETVGPILISIDDQIDLIVRKTRRQERVSFRGLLEQATSRVEIIVTLLALLEMVKQQRVTMQQGKRFGDIYIIGTPAGDSSSAAAPAPASMVPNSP